MEGLGEELDELEAEMAALEMEADAPIAVGKIQAPAGGVKVSAPQKSAQKDEEDELAAMMAM